MNSYDLSRAFWNWAFENPDKIKPVHSALYFFAIEHCNRLGWKVKFGLPTTMAKEAIGIRSYNTYINALNDLCEFGFIILIEKSKNQYSSNIIALSNFNKAGTKALDKALINHGSKQSESIDSINKPETNKPETKNKEQSDFPIFWELYNKKIDRTKCERKWNDLDQVDREKILEYIPKYIESEPEKKFRKNPYTFLNNRSWENEIIGIELKLYTHDELVNLKKFDGKWFEFHKKVENDSGGIRYAHIDTIKEFNLKVI